MTLGYVREGSGLVAAATAAADRRGRRTSATSSIATSLDVIVEDDYFRKTPVVRGCQERIHDLRQAAAAQQWRRAKHEHTLNKFRRHISEELSRRWPALEKQRHASFSGSVGTSSGSGGRGVGEGGCGGGLSSAASLPTLHSNVSQSRSVSPAPSAQRAARPARPISPSRIDNAVSVQAAVEAAVSAAAAAAGFDAGFGDGVRCANISFADAISPKSLPSFGGDCASEANMVEASSIANVVGNKLPRFGSFQVATETGADDSSTLTSIMTTLSSEGTLPPSAMSTLSQAPEEPEEQVRVVCIGDFEDGGAAVNPSYHTLISSANAVYGSGDNAGTSNEEVNGLVGSCAQATTAPSQTVADAVAAARSPECSVAAAVHVAAKTAAHAAADIAASRKRIDMIATSCSSQPSISPPQPHMLPLSLSILSSIGKGSPPNVSILSDNASKRMRPVPDSVVAADAVWRWPALAPPCSPNVTSRNDSAEIATTVATIRAAVRRGSATSPETRGRERRRNCSNDPEAVSRLSHSRNCSSPGRQAHTKVTNSTN